METVYIVCAVLSQHVILDVIVLHFRVLKLSKGIEIVT